MFGLILDILPCELQTLKQVMNHVFLFLFLSSKSVCLCAEVPLPLVFVGLVMCSSLYCVSTVMTFQQLLTGFASTKSKITYFIIKFIIRRNNFYYCSLLNLKHRGIASGCSNQLFLSHFFSSHYKITLAGWKAACFHTL